MDRDKLKVGDFVRWVGGEVERKDLCIPENAYGWVSRVDESDDHNDCYVRWIGAPEGTSNNLMFRGELEKVNDPEV